MAILLSFHGCSYSFGSEEVTLKQLRLLSLCLNIDTDTVPEKYVCINVSNDRELVDIYDEYGFKKGNTDIASRKHLLLFLRQIENADYKAIAVDLSFDLRSDSITDSLLVNQINRMQKLFVVAPTTLYLKSRMKNDRLVQSSYDVNFNEENFVKYIYRYDTSPQSSMALQAAISANPSLPVEPKRNSAILPLNYVADTQYSKSGFLNWYNLGADVLSTMSPHEIKELCKDKIIIIGDYEDRDIHDTYAGPLPGAIIILNAIECYSKGICEYGILSLVIISIILFIICLCISFDYKLFIDTHIQRKWLRFILNIVSISLVLFIIQAIEFYFSNHFHDFTGIAVWLAIYCLICQKLKSCNLFKS